MSKGIRQWQCAGEMDPDADYCKAEDFLNPLWVRCNAAEHENCGWGQHNPQAEDLNTDTKEKIQALNLQISALRHQIWELESQRESIKRSLVPDWKFVGK